MKRKKPTMIFFFLKINFKKCLNDGILLSSSWQLTWHPDLTCHLYKAFNPGVKGQAHYWQTPDRPNRSGQLTSQHSQFHLIYMLRWEDAGISPYFINKGILPWEIRVLIIWVNGPFKSCCSESHSSFSGSRLMTYIY